MAKKEIVSPPPSPPSNLLSLLPFSISLLPPFSSVPLLPFLSHPLSLPPILFPFIIPFPSPLTLLSLSSSLILFPSILPFLLPSPFPYPYSLNPSLPLPLPGKENGSGNSGKQHCRDYANTRRQVLQGICKTAKVRVIAGELKNFRGFALCSLSGASSSPWTWKHGSCYISLLLF